MILPVVILYLKWKSEWLYIFVIGLLVARIGFDLVILPERNTNGYDDKLRSVALKTGKAFADKELYIDGYININISNSYYISRERNQILKRTFNDYKPGVHYIIDPERYKGPDFTFVSEIFVRHPQKKIFQIVKINESS